MENRAIAWIHCEIWMSWYKFIENRARLDAFFGDVDPPVDVDMHEIQLRRDGPELRLRFDIAIVPSILPAKWPVNTSHTQLVLSLYGIQGMTLQGFATTVCGPLLMKCTSASTELSFKGTVCTLIASGKGRLFIHTITGYGIA